jgi:hypothetical protein
MTLNDDQRQVLWFNTLFNRAIRQTPDVSEALVCAQIAFSQAPWPPEGEHPDQYWQQVRKAFDEATAALSLEVPAPEEEPYRRRAVGWAGIGPTVIGDFPTEVVGVGAGGAHDPSPESKPAASPKKGRAGKGRTKRGLPRDLRLSKRLKMVAKRRKQAAQGDDNAL